MQFPGQGKPPTGIVFDTEMGRTIDEALALAMLYGFDGKNEARVVSVSISNPDLRAAAFCDAVGRFYAGATSPEVRAFSHGLPIGLSTDPKVPSADTPMIEATLSKATYEHDIQTLNDTADPTPLIRNALTAQYDQNAVLICGGPATNVAKVLDLPGAREVIEKKVRFLCIVTTKFNLKTDLSAARKVFAEWPTPIVAVGQEIGEALPFPGASIERDFAWSQSHPIVEAYRAYQPMPYDAPSWTLAAALYSVHSKDGYFNISDPGSMTILEDGSTKFTASADGKHQYLILDPAQKERIIETYAKVVSAKPVARQPQFPLKKAAEAAKAAEDKAVEPVVPYVKLPTPPK